MLIRRGERQMLRSENCSLRMPSSRSGGRLLFLLMLLTMLGGCGSRPYFAPCSIDESLLPPIVVDARPERPLNGDLAASRRSLADAVKGDNEKKRLLREQLR